jgi:hypothetical protein
MARVMVKKASWLEKAELGTNSVVNCPFFAPFLFLLLAASVAMILAFAGSCLYKPTENGGIAEKTVG